MLPPPSAPLAEKTHSSPSAGNDVSSAKIGKPELTGLAQANKDDGLLAVDTSPRQRSSSMTQTVEAMTSLMSTSPTTQSASLLLETSPLQLEILDNEIRNLQAFVSNQLFKQRIPLFILNFFFKAAVWRTVFIHFFAALASYFALG